MFSRPGKTFPKYFLELILNRKKIKKIIDKKKSIELKPEYNKLTSLIRKAVAIYNKNKWENVLGSFGPYPVSSRKFWDEINKAKISKQSKNFSTLIFNDLVYNSGIEEQIYSQES